MAYDDTARRDAVAAQRSEPAHKQVPIRTGIPFWDMMLLFGQASHQALSAYAARSNEGPRSGKEAHRAVSDFEVIPLAEETLHVGTRLVAGDTTRVRRTVVVTPVEQSVTLREERVIVERRKPTIAKGEATQGTLTDTALEMSDSFEVVDVWKSARITEEVVLRREVTLRTETVRETVRRDEVVVEQVPAAPGQEVDKQPPQIAADLKTSVEPFPRNAGEKQTALVSAPQGDSAMAARRPQEPPKALAG
jgi:stress response protein YsnF